MKSRYHIEHPEIPEAKRRVLYAAEAAFTLEACREARNLRSAYLREHGWDLAVLHAGDGLDAMERSLEQEALQPKLSQTGAEMGEE